jgi:hypothetical protein
MDFESEYFDLRCIEVEQMRSISLQHELMSVICMACQISDDTDGWDSYH